MLANKIWLIDCSHVASSTVLTVDTHMRASLFTSQNTVIHCFIALNSSLHGNFCHAKTLLIIGNIKKWFCVINSSSLKTFGFDHSHDHKRFVGFFLLFLDLIFNDLYAVVEHSDIFIFVFCVFIWWSKNKWMTGEI